MINFQPTGDGKTAITGDFVITANEVNPLIRALRENSIEVTAIHSHMLDEQPRIVFSSVTVAMDRSVFSGEATFRPLRGWNSRPMPTISGSIQSRIWYSQVSVQAGLPLSTQSRAKSSARSIIPKALSLNPRAREPL